MEIPGQPVPSTPPPATTSSRDAWERIKQHKVVQWTLAYLALAYTLLHGAELLGNSLGWSHGLLRVFTLLLIMGVPVVIIVSWYHGARGITVAKDPKFARAWEVLGAVLVIGTIGRRERTRSIRRCAWTRICRWRTPCAPRFKVT